MLDSENHLEDLLRRYKPAGPDAAMRGRVLAAARAAEPVSLPMKLWWGTIAAMFLISGVLFFAAISNQSQSMATLATPLPPLSQETEAAIAQLGNEEDTRVYKYQVRLLAVASVVRPQHSNLY